RGRALARVQASAANEEGAARVIVGWTVTTRSAGPARSSADAARLHGRTSRGSGRNPAPCGRGCPAWKRIYTRLLAGFQRVCPVYDVETSLGIFFQLAGAGVARFTATVIREQRLRSERPRAAWRHRSSALSSRAVPFRGRNHPSCARRRGGTGRDS